MVLRAVKLGILSFVVLAAAVCIQAYLIEGPEALSHVHLDLLRMVGALKQAIVRVLRLLVISIQKARSGKANGDHVEFHMSEDSFGLWDEGEEETRP